jgi:hypothetical protein
MIQSACKHLIRLGTGSNPSILKAAARETAAKLALTLYGPHKMHLRSPENLENKAEIKNCRVRADSPILIIEPLVRLYALDVIAHPQNRYTWSKRKRWSYSRVRSSSSGTIWVGGVMRL